MVKITNQLFRKTILFGFFLLLPFWLFAGTTGKIAGVVKDRQTGEPLPGVNIQIKGTYMGAASDIQGNYFIISVPPGEYTLLAKMMGYSSTEVQNVKVSIDQTTKIDFFLDQGVIDLGESVIVEAERPVIQRDLTTSIEVMGIDEIQQSTALDIEEVVNLSTGVFFDPVPTEGNLVGNGRGEARYSIRGGEQDEVMWYVDGARAATINEATADAGGSFTNINKEAVKEIQVITGGFNAEYGQAQSGIVNVITKDGDDKYRFSIDYNYSPRHQRHFGDYLYDRSKNKEFLDHTLEDGSLDPAWWTEERQLSVYDYRDFDDHEVKFSLGGPMAGAFFPLIGDEFKKMTFFLTGRYQQQAYTLPRPKNTRDMTNINLSGKYTITPNMNIKFGGMYNHDAHATNREESFRWAAKYYRGYGTLLDNYTYQARLGLTHAINDKSFYEIKLSSYTLRQKQRHSPYRILGESMTKVGIFLEDGYEGYQDEGFLLYYSCPVSNNVMSNISLVGTMNYQIDHNNLLKSGIEFHYNTYKEDSWVLPSFSDDMNDWINRGLNETYHPLQFSFYIQDKMEFESMILNIGLRYDMFDGNRDWYTKDSFIFSPALDTDYQISADPELDGIDTLGHKAWDFNNVLAKSRERVKPSHSFNPRLGFSFPISDRSVFHFSYGHFYQMPAINSLFDFAFYRPPQKVKGEPSTAFDSNSERVTTMTLEPLEPEKTIQFEMGLKHHFENIAVLNITGFYKDIYDQVERPGFLDKRIMAAHPYSTSSKPELAYCTRYSGDYGDARGVEVSLRTLFSNNFILDFNYSFSKSTFGKGTPEEIHIDDEGNVSYQWYSKVEDRIPSERSYSRPHILRANFFMKFPQEWNIPGLSHVFKNSDTSLLYRYISGRAFTHRDDEYDPPDLVDNHRLPGIQTWDLKFNKYFQLGYHTLTFYTNITNLFNQKSMRNFFLFSDVTGMDLYDEPLRAAAEKFLETGQPTTEFLGYNYSYMIYNEPRSIWIGIKYNFR